MRLLPTALALLALAGPAEAADRAPRTPPPNDAAPDDLPIQSLGRVNRRTGGFCTGTLVGNRLVLTAAHCLWNTRTRDWLPPDSLHFVAGYDRGNYRDESAVARYEMAPERRDAGERGRIELDWAVLVLERTIGGTLGFVPIGDARRQMQGDRPLAVVHATYRQDRAHALSVQARCALTGPAARRVFLHDCAATHGASGAPLLMRIGGAYQVVAIGVALGTVDGKSVGLAVPATAAELPE